MYWSGVTVCKQVYSFGSVSIAYSIILTFIHHKKAFIYKNLQCNYLVPVFLEHLLQLVHSEWITFSGNSHAAECFHWYDEQLCWFQPWPLKKNLSSIVKLERPKAYITEYIYVTNINKIKNKRDNICKAAPCTVFTEQWILISENLFGSQVKKKSRQSKRQFESPRGGEGKHLWKFGWRFATEAFKPWPCFRQKPFTLLPCSRPCCTTNIHPMFKVSGPERHPVVSPGSHFLSCQAILIPNNGSYVICAPRYSWSILSDNIRPRGAQITQDPN